MEDNELWEYASERGRAVPVLLKAVFQVAIQGKN